VYPLVVELVGLLVVELGSLLLGKDLVGPLLAVRLVAMLVEELVGPLVTLLDQMSDVLLSAVWTVSVSEVTLVGWLVGMLVVTNLEDELACSWLVE
jgi:hypothetical protein